MNEPGELERLITRHLDDACGPDERRRLERLTRRDPRAEAMFEEYAALDREVGAAMRQALGRSAGKRLRGGGGGWTRWRRALSVGMAACLAGVLWLAPPERAPTARGPRQAGSLFAAPPTAHDTLDQRGASVFGRPQIRVDVPDREWILVPGEVPGEYLVVEVNRVRSRTIFLHEDF